MKQTHFIEYEFSAYDKDSCDGITDVVMINARLTDNEEIKKAIIHGFETHPVISISGNTWELTGVRETGRRMTQTLTYEETHKREGDCFGNEYPQVQNG